MQHAQTSLFDAQAYLSWEEKQTDKHEFMAGEIFAMGGARREHVIVSLNIASALKQRLRDTPCLTYMADMKLRVEQVNAFFYPDVMVSCHQEDRQAEQFLSYPTLIVEVLSDSTAAFDRGDKFAAYRRLLSLQEYVRVDIKGGRVECYQRMAENEWLLHDYRGDDRCELFGLEVDIPLSEIFEAIEII